MTAQWRENEHSGTINYALHIPVFPGRCTPPSEHTNQTATKNETNPARPGYPKAQDTIAQVPMAFQRPATPNRREARLNNK